MASSGRQGLDVSVVGVVGAGFMGSGIAESAARAGKYVVLHAPDEAPLERSRAGLRRSLAKAAARGKVADPDAVLARIVHSTRLEDRASADAVLEAIVDDPKVKGPALPAP